MQCNAANLHLTSCLDPFLAFIFAGPCLPHGDYRQAVYVQPTLTPFTFLHTWYLAFLFGGPGALANKSDAVFPFLHFFSTFIFRFLVAEAFSVLSVVCSFV